ncbi:hypothetical protein GCM10025872_17650 [Barrientosiimonas endolithica]|uniref:Bacterial bifunctional deaminase-reductase C-terminal domain-containing protein n=1 Tax=Barrientosiimonas endolithica TaxID=1535208 RepID=A0ABN6YL89_9MICO|nr:hypothetical protein GCM10025872_17650 [Barrientosiimonas endolithica]
MRELYPGTTQSDDNTESERELLLRLYDAPGPLLRLNFVSTLDGAATGEDNRSGTINTEADTRVFALLRAWADAIVVGAGTARAERYEVPDIDEEWQPLRTGRPARPLLVVVSAQDQLPPLLADAAEDEVLLISGDPVAPETRCAPCAISGTSGSSSRAGRTSPTTSSPPARSTSCASPGHRASSAASTRASSSATRCRRRAGCCPSSKPTTP